MADTQKAPSRETEEALIQRAQDALNQCNWVIGECAATWTERYDPDMIGPALSGEQWSVFENAVAATVAFLDAARVARNARRDTA